MPDTPEGHAIVEPSFFPVPPQFMLALGDEPKTGCAESQFGTKNGLRQELPTGTLLPDELKASAVAEAETLTVVNPNIFAKRVGSAFPFVLSL